MTRIRDAVPAPIDEAADESVDFASALIRLPTVNPPGDAYDDCARLIGYRLTASHFLVDYISAIGRAEQRRAKLVFLITPR